VGLFAAAMSSIDSALNSLSASTVEDFIARFRECSERQLFIYSKLATLGWGLFAVLFSFQVESIAPTVLEAINKVGSMANGPLLGLFSIAVFLPALGQRAAIGGFLGGLLCNMLVWKLLPDVSWLWWNVIGCGAAWLIALVIAAILSWQSQVQLQPGGEAVAVPRVLVGQLLSMSCLILGVCGVMTLM
jgi:SSS family solute:Na+ symporter